MAKSTVRRKIWSIGDGGSPAIEEKLAGGEVVRWNGADEGF